MASTGGLPGAFENTATAQTVIGGITVVDNGSAKTHHQNIRNP